ncbi:MAG: hypothetical protein SV377_03280 [Halobacteria archaeon]|nr:hypothetical protein [Halobacteria archaeon]
MKESELTVAEAYPNDSARGIARLDPDVIQRVDLDPGDVIEIAGNKRTVARVWRADKKDWNTDTIRVDSFTRRNAGVDVGEVVTVRKAITRNANKVVLSPLETTSLKLTENTSNMLKRLIIDRPTVEGDILPVMNQDNPFIQSSDDVISMAVVETEPGGVVTITESTDLELREPNKG